MTTAEKPGRASSGRTADRRWPKESTASSGSMRMPGKAQAVTRETMGDAPGPGRNVPQADGSEAILA